MDSQPRTACNRAADNPICVRRPRMFIRAAIRCVIVRGGGITASNLKSEGQIAASLLLQIILPQLSPVPRCLRRWVRPDKCCPLLDLPLNLTRSKADLIIENAFLLQQLVIHRQVKRPRLRRRNRLGLVLLASWLSTWKQALPIVQPETLSRWHRKLFRRLCQRKSGPARSPADLHCRKAPCLSSYRWFRITAPGEQNAFSGNCRNRGSG